jgi:hypothetical protein
MKLVQMHLCKCKRLARLILVRDLLPGRRMQVGRVIVPPLRTRPVRAQHVRGTAQAMSYRRRLPTALLMVVLGCGGKTGGAAAGGDGSASSSGTSSATSSGMTEQNSEGASSSGATSSGGSGSGSEGGSAGNLDAEIPDAFPVSCAQFTFVLQPDAAPNTCAVSPADVACNTNSDCSTYVWGCGCIEEVYGVNTSSTVRCTWPPCPLCSSADASGYYTEDCKLVSELQNVAVACVNGQCMTYAPDAGSE